MEPVHVEVLAAARACAGRGWLFRLADLVRALPHRNPGTVRTHVASRCCVNAPANHASRHPYFRLVARGRYRIEPAFRTPPRPRRTLRPSQDRILASIDSGIDATLVDESLRMTPSDRLDTMRAAALSLDAMKER